MERARKAVADAKAVRDGLVALRNTRNADGEVLDRQALFTQRRRLAVVQQQIHEHTLVQRDAKEREDACVTAMREAEQRMSVLQRRNEKYQRWLTRLKRERSRMRLREEDSMIEELVTCRRQD
ncbi:hypothetical protein VL15_38255 [Burkholderia cepacia]|uniref:Type III secretion protein n=2 Tax=Burkholderia cepacia TaxID=292 RepID=A0A0J5VWU3_BURCE|nr:hypothetical protein VL15_38255 [Burkholderia cepacia]